MSTWSQEQKKSMSPHSTVKTTLLILKASTMIYYADLIILHRAKKKMYESTLKKDFTNTYSK